MRMAQNWAQTNANACQMYHSSNRGGAGENLYATSGGLSNGKDPVDCWYNEIKDYRYGSGFSMATGKLLVSHTSIVQNWIEFIHDCIPLA